MTGKPKNIKTRRANKNDLSITSANALRIMMKDPQDIRADLKSKTVDGNHINYTYDLFYRNVNGTLTIVTEEGKIIIAALNLAFGKVFNLMNDANMEKVASYVLKEFPA